MKGSELKERLQDMGFKMRQVADSMGMSPQNLNQKLNAADVKSGFIEDLCNALSIDKCQLQVEVEQAMPDKVSGKPFYDVPFELGYKLPYNDNTSNPDSIIYFDQFNSCDFWCRAKGHSMMPTISNGDIVALKEIRDFRYLVNNEVYAVVMRNDLRTIKRIKDKGDFFVFIPDNKEYEEQTIPKEEVIAVYKVLGSMKIF